MEIRLGEMDDGWVEMQLLQLTQDSIRRKEPVFPLVMWFVWW